MSKQFTLLCMLLWAVGNPLHACDVCGASVNAQAALISLSQRNMIGLGWSITPFNVREYHGEGAAERYLFIQSELWGQFSFGKPWTVQVRIPYRNNIQYRHAADNQTLSGIGDAQLQVRWLAFAKAESPRSKLFIQSGVGLPTGKYQSLNQQGVPENASTGRGALSYNISAILLYAITEEWNIVAQTAFTAGGYNDRGYKFGNQWTLQTLISCAFPIGKKSKTIPLMGIFAEQTDGDRRKGLSRKVHGTEGKALLAQIGVDCNIDNTFALSLRAYQPIIQYYAEGEIETGTRASATISYTF